MYIKVSNQAKVKERKYISIHLNIIHVYVSKLANNFTANFWII